jgi:hypothetical protein
MSNKDIFLIPKIKTNNYSYYKYFIPYIFNNNKPQSIYNSKNTECKEYFETECRKLMIIQLREQLDISPSINRFNNKFLNIEHLNYYRSIDTDLKYNYNIDIHSNLNNIIHFPQKQFITDIYNTYSTEEDTVKQFTVDFPRHKVYVNTTQITEISELFTILAQYNRKIEIKGCLKTTSFILALLLICQSSFYMSFMHVFNKINKMKENYIINTQTDLYDTDVIPLLNYHITDTKKINEIHFTIDEFGFCCTFIASYKIINIYTEHVVHQIKAETIFDLKFDDCLIVYESI